MNPIDENIIDFLKRAGGEPFTYREIWKTMTEQGNHYNFRTIMSHLDNLTTKESMSGIRSKKIGKAIVVWYGWDLPIYGDREALDEMALNGQYPLHLIITKIRETAKPAPDGTYIPSHLSIESEKLLRESKQSLDRTIELLSKAEKEILWWGGDLSAFDELYGPIEDALKRGLCFKMIMNINLFSLENAKKVLELQKAYPNFELRHWASEWRGIIVDRKYVRLIQKFPKKPEIVLPTGKPGRDKDFYYQAWAWLIEPTKYNVEPWVNWFCKIWEAHWEKAKMSPQPSTLVEELSKIKKTGIQ